MTDFIQPDVTTMTSAVYKAAIDQAVAALNERSQFALKSVAPNPFFQVDQLANSATSVADDVYGHDHWYALTQTAAIQISTQTLQENVQSTNARLNQNQAAAQRMGYACIIEAKEAQKYRGQVMTFRPRVRISASQAVRCAVLEWTGTADAVTSDVVNDWTSGTYTGGNFFVATSFNVLGTNNITPSAAAWTDMTGLSVTVGSSCNNLVLFVWTEGTAAQNVTLDLGKIRFVPGNVASNIYIPSFDETLRYAMRFYEKSFDYQYAPQQNLGGTTGLYNGAFQYGQFVGASVSHPQLVFPFKVTKRSSPSITTYNPFAASAQFRNVGNGTNCTSAAVSALGADTVRFDFVTAAGSAVGDVNAVHWTAGIRL